MGHIRHHAIVVTSWQDAAIEAAWDEARAIGCTVSGIVPSPTNFFRSFLIAPDGSKEGWDSSDQGDAQRARFIAWTAEFEGYLHWAEVMFGDEDRVVRVRTDDGVEIAGHG